MSRGHRDAPSRCRSPLEAVSSLSEIPSAGPHGLVTHASGIPEWDELGLD